MRLFCRRFFKYLKKKLCDTFRIVIPRLYTELGLEGKGNDRRRVEQDLGPIPRLLVES